MSTQQNITDKALAKIADLIVQRMEELKGQKWEKPWFSNTYQGVPQNIAGRPYNGMNELILDFATASKNHEFPVFLTFNQAVKEGVRINKGASSIPILYYERSYKDANGKTLSDNQVKELSLDQMAQLEKRVVLRKFDVFNVGDTNFKEVKPEIYEQLKKQYAVKGVKIQDDQGMYSNKELDRMFAKQEWICPIEIKSSQGAFYTPALDRITLPLKAQFKTGNSAEEVYRNGMEFYSTAIHEMAHSTGSANRLNRVGGKKFGDAAYAKEELVAELTAARVGRSVGFDRQLADNSAKYLNSWVGALKSEPRFVLTVLNDVAKAHGVIMGEIEKQQIALQQTSQQSKEEQSRSSSVATDATLVKKSNGEYAVRGKVDGVDTGLLPIDKKSAVEYFRIGNVEQKSSYLKEMVLSAHKEVASPKVRQSVHHKL